MRSISSILVAAQMTVRRNMNYIFLIICRLSLNWSSSSGSFRCCAEKTYETGAPSKATPMANYTPYNFQYYSFHFWYFHKFLPDYTLQYPRSRRHGNLKSQLEKIC
jgi:hypothetical protein